MISKTKKDFNGVFMTILILKKVVIMIKIKLNCRSGVFYMTIKDEYDWVLIPPTSQYHLRLGSSTQPW